MMATSGPSDVEIYKMTSIPRGICVIINNKTFQRDRSNPSSLQLDDRPGTDKDAEALKETFGALGFDVEKYDNVQSTRMYRIMEDVTRKNHRDFDCFVCCFLSHGNLGKVYGSDGVAVGIRGLADAVKPQRCPDLTGKPKVFIMQACQGNERQIGYPALEADAAAVQQELIPNEADFLFAYSTVPGFVSYRNRNTGSCFIQELTTHLKSLQKPTDIHQILTKVNAEVSKMTKNRGYTQSPAPLYSLRKHLLIGPLQTNTNQRAVRPPSDRHRTLLQHTAQLSVIDTPLETLRVMIVGPAGTGKSSLGNSLLGSSQFQVRRGVGQETKFCNLHLARRGPLTFEIVDTPNMRGTHLSQELMSRELIKGLAMASPGPHLWILTLRCNRFFTQTDYQAFAQMRRLFSDQMLKYTIVVFTGLDAEDNVNTLEERKKRLKEAIPELGEGLGEVLHAVKHRFIGMDNTCPAETRERFTRNIIDLMMATVKQNEYQYYTGPHSQRANQLFEDLVKRRQRRNNMSRDEAELSARRAIADREEDDLVNQL